MRILGIDYGEKRIGIAVSDPTATLARPVESVAGGRDQRVAVAHVVEAISRIERDDEPIASIVVGLPSHLDGSANDQTPRVESFAVLLRKRTGKQVVLQDERLTSHEADGLLAARERDWRARKKRLDAAAAAVILQEYLDAQKSAGDSTPEQSNVE